VDLADIIGCVLDLAASKQRIVIEQHDGWWESGRYMSIAVSRTAPAWTKEIWESVPPPKKLARMGVRIMIT
jgi:hypothetical protein